MQRLKNTPEELRPKLGKYYLLTMSIIIITILIIYFLTLKINPKEYFDYVLQLKSDVMNETLMQLKNANTISNLPKLIIESGNVDINNLTDCTHKIKYLGDFTTNSDTLDSYRTVCKNTCGGAGQLLVVEGENDYVFQNEFVKPGVYCTVEPPNCNMNTGYIVATINSSKCVSKYPRLFGGESASTIIACNDEKHPSTGSILWDYSNNEPVDPKTVLMTHENETLPDGSYRFRCKYNETQNKNPYIAHPVDRFHPIVDKCNDTIYAASYAVHANVTSTGWECDCGNFDETRVKHLDESNPKSTCTSCFREITGDKFSLPYICFRESSPYTMPKNYQPCLEYSGNGNFCSTMDLKVLASNSKELFINTPMSNVIPESILDTRHRVYTN